MGGFRRFELIDGLCFPTDSSIFSPKALTSSLCPSVEHLFHDNDLVAFSSLHLFHSPSLLAPAPAPFEIFADADLIQIDPIPPLCSPYYRRLVEHRVAAAESTHLRSLSDRISALEKRFDRLLGSAGRDRKYTWTAEIKNPAEDGFDRKCKLTEEIKGGRNQAAQRNYKWVTEIRGGRNQASRKKVVEVEEEDGLLKNYKWSAHVKGKDGEESPIERSYSFKAANFGAGEGNGSGKKEKGKNEKKEEKKVKKEKKEAEKKEESATRVVKIEDPADHGAIVLRQVVKCPL